MFYPGMVLQSFMISARVHLPHFEKKVIADQIWSSLNFKLDRVLADILGR